MSLGIILFVAFVLLTLVSNAIFILREYERGVVFFLGRLQSNPVGPGIIFIIPGIQKLVRVSMRTIVFDVPPQDIITKDNVSVKVNAVVYFRVLNPIKAIVEVEDYLYATSQLSQTTLRAILGQVDLDALLSDRERLNDKLQETIDQQTDPWGVKVSMVEVKHVDLPQEMQRAMAKQAEAEREKRAKIIHAEGEFQAAAQLNEAANILAKNSIAMQLRYLQTLTEIGAEKNSTIVFPVPVDTLKAFIGGPKA